MKKRSAEKFINALIFGTLCEGSPKVDKWMSKKLASKVCDAVLLPFQVDRQHLKNVLICMRLMDVIGLTVEGSLRQDIAKYLPELDDSAKRANSVDTIIKSRKSFKGYSSIGLACLKWLDEEGIKSISNAVIAGKSDFINPVAGALLAKGAKLRRIRSTSRIATSTKEQAPTIAVIGNLDAALTKKLFSVIKNSWDKPIIIDLRDSPLVKRKGVRAPCMTMQDLIKKSREISVELLTCSIKY
ncbi:MAG: hypothetical protein ABH871_00920 [Pseudomonadota bacterium]